MKSLKEDVEDQIEHLTWEQSQYGVFDHRYDQIADELSLFERILDNLKSNE